MQRLSKLQQNILFELAIAMRPHPSLSVHRVIEQARQMSGHYTLDNNHMLHQALKRYNVNRKKDGEKHLGNKRPASRS